MKKLNLFLFAGFISLLIGGCGGDYSAVYVPVDSGAKKNDTKFYDYNADTGTPDTDKPDTGRPDTGPPDTGRPDIGQLDIGPSDTDTEDTGRPDTGIPDTGPPDCNPAFCKSGKCLNGQCAPPPCLDGVKNGDESDVDCGGRCDDCTAGKACNDADDCTSSVCNDGTCAAPTCSDGVQNGNEKGVDCGGSCRFVCGNPCLPKKCRLKKVNPAPKAGYVNFICKKESWGQTFLSVPVPQLATRTSDGCWAVTCWSKAKKAQVEDKICPPKGAPAGD